MTTVLYEKKIIGGIIGGIIQPSAIQLEPSDLSELGDVFAICLQLEKEKRPISADLLAARLSESDSFYSAVDFNLWRETARSSAVVLECADKVKGAALKTYLTEKLASIVVDGTKSGVGILDELKGILAYADKNYRTHENNFVFLKDIVPKLEAVYRDLYAGMTYAVSTGFEAIDNLLLDGFSKGDLHIVAAFTGHGKSAFALNCARKQAEVGMIVGAVSREMSDIENSIRLQTSKQSIPRGQVRKQMFHDTFEKLMNGVRDLGKLPIALDTRTDDVENLRIQTRRMVEQFDLKILYVDYLQLMKSEKNAKRAEEVAAVSRGLKLIAMENNIPVVALCQFNREGRNATVYDLLGHLKESSGIEQDASTILYIELEKTQEVKDVKSAQLIVLKNRNGATFQKVELDYHGAIFTFKERQVTEGYNDRY